MSAGKRFSLVAALAVLLCGCPQQGGGKSEEGPVAGSAEGGGEAADPTQAETYCVFKLDGDAFQDEQVALTFAGQRMDDAYWLYSDKHETHTRLGFNGKWKHWKVSLTLSLPDVAGPGSYEIPVNDHGFNTGCTLTFYDRDVPADQRPSYFVTGGTVTLEPAEGDFVKGSFQLGLVSQAGGLGKLINGPPEERVTAKVSEGQLRAKFDERMSGAQRWPASGE